jgi:hypothetical protein
MLITFSGLDGAGKTTLIAQLTRELTASGRSVTCFTKHEDIGVFSAIRRFRRRRGLLPRDGLAPRCDTVRWTPLRRTMQAARRFLQGRLVTAVLLPVDLLLFKMRRRAAACDVLILDRYFYDSFVELRSESTWWARAFLRVLPTPDLSVFVDIDPAVAFARKGEVGVPELSRREAAYRRLFGRLPHGVTIRNDSLEVAKRQLSAAVFARLVDCFY